MSPHIRSVQSRLYVNYSDELEAEMLVSSLAMDSINKNGILLQAINQLERKLLQSWNDGSPSVTKAPGQAAVEGRRPKIMDMSIEYLQILARQD